MLGAAGRTGVEAIAVGEERGGSREAGGSSQFLESRFKSEEGSVESYGLEPLGPGKALRPPLLTSLL